MSIDSAQKRRAAIGLPFAPTLPTPDGSVSRRDRWEVAGTPAVFTGAVSGAGTYHRTQERVSTRRTARALQP